MYCQQEAAGSVGLLQQWLCAVCCVRRTWTWTHAAVDRVELRGGGGGERGKREKKGSLRLGQRASR
jgi:hypothetical protein